MTVSEKEIGNVCVLAPRGRLDGNSASDFEETLTAIIDGGKTRLVMDLAELVYISSAGLRTLLTAAKKIKTVDGQLAFCGLNDTVKEVFEISGFTAILNVADSLDAAVAAVGD